MNILTIVTVPETNNTWLLRKVEYSIKQGFDFTVFELVLHKFTVFQIACMHICNVYLFMCLSLPFDCNFFISGTLMVIIFGGVPRG